VRRGWWRDGAPRICPWYWTLSARRLGIIVALSVGLVAAGVAALPVHVVPTECLIAVQLDRINGGARPEHRMQPGEVEGLALQTRISCERWGLPWEVFLAIVNNESCGAWEPHDHQMGYGWVALQEHEAEDRRVLRKLGLDGPKYVKGSNWKRCRRDTRHYINVATCYLATALEEEHQGDLWKMLLYYNKGPRKAPTYIAGTFPRMWPYVWVGPLKNPEWSVGVHYRTLTKGGTLPRYLNKDGTAWEKTARSNCFESAGFRGSSK